MEDGSCSLNLGSRSEDTHSVATQKRTKAIQNNKKRIRMSFSCENIYSMWRNWSGEKHKLSVALVAGFYPCRWLQTQLVFSGIYCSWEIIWTALSRMWYSMWNDSFENFMKTQYHQEPLNYLWRSWCLHHKHVIILHETFQWTQWNHNRDMWKSKQPYIYTTCVCTHFS